MRPADSQVILAMCLNPPRHRHDGHNRHNGYDRQRVPFGRRGKVALRASSSRGTRWTISKEELDILQHPCPKDTRPPRQTFLPLEEAHDQILNMINAIGKDRASDSQNAASQRIKDLWSNDERDNPDVTIKAFNDLAKFLFIGRLQRRVCLHWSARSSMPSLGTTSYHADDTIEIELNMPELVRKDGKLRDYKLAWAVLIHGMLHAYIVVMCARGEDWKEPWPHTEGKHSHGHTFRNTLQVIRKKLWLMKDEMEYDNVMDQVHRVRGYSCREYDNGSYREVERRSSDSGIYSYWDYYGRYRRDGHDDCHGQHRRGVHRVQASASHGTPCVRRAFLSHTCFDI
ncbi:hypothetical protein LTR04_000897 [Oleoguttula sp. CCFEE 6159]|nr:hypothetical protein LTR04_000897 [Oleoguttula sp. CCFEE 6159]